MVNNGCKIPEGLGNRICGHVAWSSWIPRTIRGTEGVISFSQDGAARLSEILCRFPISIMKQETISNSRFLNMIHIHTLGAEGGAVEVGI